MKKSILKMIRLMFHFRHDLDYYNAMGTQMKISHLRHPTTLMGSHLLYNAYWVPCKHADCQRLHFVRWYDMPKDHAEWERRRKKRDAEKKEEAITEDVSD